ncbi:MAG: hypothetical protein LBG21_04055 [Campylobacteraceae bacterium]|jgi:hypothetical protein|nr:hypothetical protein [Campylobacteraceae bacterium]
MKKITENNIRVTKFRVKQSKVPSFNRLAKLKGFISKEEFAVFVYKAITAYQSLLENPAAFPPCAQEVTKCDNGNSDVKYGGDA